MAETQHEGEEGHSGEGDAGCRRKRACCSQDKELAACCVS